MLSSVSLPSLVANFIVCPIIIVFIIAASDPIDFILPDSSFL